MENNTTNQRVSESERIVTEILLGPKAEDNKNQDWLRGRLNKLITAVSRQARAEAIEDCARVVAKYQDVGEMIDELEALKAQEPCKTDAAMKTLKEAQNG